MMKRIVMGQVRHVATLVAGYLVGQGLIEQSMVEPFIGIVLALTASGWSLLDKRG